MIYALFNAVSVVGLLVGLLAVLTLENSPASASEGKLGSLVPPIEIAQPPPRGTIPDDHKPAGTRGPCADTDLPFVPLIPLTESRFLGFTLETHPTFWFYLPYAPTEVSSGKFLITTEARDTVYQTEVNLPQTSGFVSVQIPSTMKPLAADEWYRWQFTLSCGAADESDPDLVWHQGWIKRIQDPELADWLAQLDSETPDQAFQLRVNHQLWYDATAHLENIRANPALWDAVLRVTAMDYLEHAVIAGEATAIAE